MWKSHCDVLITVTGLRLFLEFLNFEMSILQKPAAKCIKMTQRQNIIASYFGYPLPSSNSENQTKIWPALKEPNSKQWFHQYRRRIREPKKNPEKSNRLRYTPGDLNAHLAKYATNHRFKGYSQRLKHEKSEGPSSSPIAENHEIAAGVDDS